MTRPKAPAAPRVRALEDALRDLAQAHGLDDLVRTVPLGTQQIIRDAVTRSDRRFAALAAARTEARR